MRRWHQLVARAARINTGEVNVRRFEKLQSRVRPTTRIALDTTVFQIANYERGAWYSTGKAMWGDFEIDTGFAGPMNPVFPTSQQEQIPFLYSLCELARNGTVTFVLLPTVEGEKAEAKDKHSRSLGCTPLDHGIRYQQLEFSCTRMKFSHSVSWGPLTKRKEDECKFDIGRHSLIFHHLRGKSQQKDAWHLMICDAFGVDVFLTVDEKFIRSFRQIEERLVNLGFGTKVMTPKEFCEACNLRPTHPPDADPQAIMRGSIR
ncbi:hypothetical protein EV216_1206 [Rhodovulum steppense]|uniref:Uncharacterized protein n=1 Tax=Rhodovulum steppense TaxID=540251 RepID=A0A4R1YPY7_9RHOB|nr:hypothetical protein EV216_1206 [Rhodovulum steppense]